ncbi:hypothetical protein [Roseivivax sp. CAU 1761]
MTYRLVVALTLILAILALTPRSGQANTMGGFDLPVMVFPENSQEARPRPLPLPAEPR